MEFKIDFFFCLDMEFKMILKSDKREDLRGICFNFIKYLVV